MPMAQRPFNKCFLRICLASSTIERLFAAAIMPIFVLRDSSMFLNVKPAI